MHRHFHEKRLTEIVDEYLFSARTEQPNLDAIGSRVFREKRGGESVLNPPPAPLSPQ